MTNSVDVRVKIRDQELNIFAALARFGQSFEDVSDVVVSVLDMEVNKSFCGEGDEVEEVVVRLGSMALSMHPVRVYEMQECEAWPWWKRLLNLFSEPKLEPLPEPTYKEATVNRFAFHTDEGAIYIDPFTGQVTFEGFKEEGYQYYFEATLVLDNANRRGRRILLN